MKKMLFLLSLILLTMLFKLSEVGATTIWEKYSDNPVLDIGSFGSWDDQSVWAPTVLWKNGLYRMWYSGGRNDHNIRIGFATSPDGISWTRNESNPVLNISTSGWDSFQVNSPSVLFNGSHYCMWYSGDNGNNIGLATSSDGVNWTKHSGNPVFYEGRYPTVLFDGSIYKMWYEGYDYTINYATSPDGISWTEDVGNPVLTHGPSGSWDGMYVSTPSVIFDGSLYIMSYSGYRDSMLSREIGLAYSPDGITWSKDTNNPVNNVSPPGAWDDTHVDHSTLLLIGSSLKMWYSGFDGTCNESVTYYHRIGLAYHTPYPYSRIEIPIKGGENATIESNVTITNALVTKNTLHFDASGPTGSTGWINVTFPMVNTTEIKVFINQVKLTPPPFPIITTNGTHYFIYFEFTLSTHSIDIQFGPIPVGGISIPVDKLELLAPYIGLTILLAVAVVTVVYVKKRKRNT